MYTLLARSYPFVKNMFSTPYKVHAFSVVYTPSSYTCDPSRISSSDSYSLLLTITPLGLKGVFAPPLLSLRRAAGSVGVSVCFALVYFLFVLLSIYRTCPLNDPFGPRGQ